MEQKELLKKKKVELVDMLLDKENEAKMLRNHNKQLSSQVEHYIIANDDSDQRISLLRKGIEEWREICAWVVGIACGIILLCLIL